MITKITKAYTRNYRDTGQTTVYVEWLDDAGEVGRTEGECVMTCHGWLPVSIHMGELFKRAKREGVVISHETR